ncbi:MAG: HlyD family secretion protein [Congregibacter sp.]
MLELLFTSFPVLFRYFQLKRRQEPLSLWNLKGALFLWAIMAFSLFLVIFYFHPKTTAAVVPFRTVSVVAQTSGPVTEIAVTNGQHVEAGDLLFRIEDSAQRAALREAEAQLDLIDAEEGQAAEDLVVAQAHVEEVQSELAKVREQLDDTRVLVTRGLASANSLLEIETSVTSTEAELRARLAELELTEIALGESILAQRNAALVAVDSARTQLRFTEVHSYVDGVVTQLALSLGSPATTLVFSPAMLIIPDRPKDTATLIVAGFSQVSKSVLHVGMPVEVACDSNADLLFRNAIFPAKIASIQPAVATGQVLPDGQLRDLEGTNKRGTVPVYVELLYEEHDRLLLDGSGCKVQAYTNSIDGVFGHIVSLTGVIKAAGLRLAVLGKLITGSGLAGGAH